MSVPEPTSRVWPRGSMSSRPTPSITSSRPVRAQPPRGAAGAADRARRRPCSCWPLAMAILRPDGAGWGTAAWLVVICARAGADRVRGRRGPHAPAPARVRPDARAAAAGLDPAGGPRRAAAAPMSRSCAAPPGPAPAAADRDSSFSLAPALVIVLAGAPMASGRPRPVPRGARRPDGLRPRDLLAADPGRARHRPARRAARVRVGLRRRPVPGAASASWPRWPAARIRRCSSPCCRSAGLLALFAHERRGRIENALALQRAGPGGPRAAADDRPELLGLHRDRRPRRHAADAHRLGRADLRPRLGGRAGRAAAGLRARRRRRARARVPRTPWPRSRRTSRTRPSGGCATTTARYRHIAAVATNLLDDARVRGHRRSPCATSRPARPSRSSCATARSTTRCTGLANRALFYDRVEHALTRGARDDAQVARAVRRPRRLQGRSTTLAGTRTATGCCRRSRSRLTACLRAADTAARLGGDEFGVLLEGVADPAR